MKNYTFIILLLVLAACEDQVEVTYRYARPYFLSKEYPIFWDASDQFVDIQVKPFINPDKAFKIVSNEYYYFVGEKMKGIHVYKKTDAYQTSPLCFIECKSLKAFDVKEDMLYCNNFIDLLVVDVGNPLQAKIIHRERDFFNRYSNSRYNYPSSETGRLYIIGYKQVILTGKETQKDRVPDFSEYDKLYGNIIVKQIPDSLQSNIPVVGIANAEGEIYTFGTSSLDLCSYASGVFKSTPTAISFPSYPYVSLDNLVYKNGTFFFFWNNIYFSIPSSEYNQHGPAGTVLFDVVPLIKRETNYLALSDNYIVGFFIAGESVNFDSKESYGATSLLNVNDTILALGDQLRLYSCYNQFIGEVKQYPAISGTAMLQESNKLIVVNKEGLSIYDISDLRNIIQR